jgi:MFS family permease
MATLIQGKYRTALRVRDLRLLVGAFVVDQAASWSYNVVLIAYLFERTGSTSWVTGLVTVRWIVGLLAGGYAGVLADRYDRRTVLVVSGLASLAATLVVAALVATDGPLPAILAAAGLLAATCTPVRPASGALVPEVVDEGSLLAANSIFAFLESLVVVLGPGIGAVLLLTGDPVYGVLLNAASFLVSALLYAQLTVRSHGDAEPGGNPVKQWGAGVSALLQHRQALVLTGFLLLDSAAINAANVVMPALAAHLGGGAAAYSVLLGANALGGVVAAGLANKLAGSSRVTAIITLSIALECVPLWASVFAGAVPSAALLQILSGAGMVIVDVIAFTSLQRDLPREVLGRVLGSVDMLLLAGSIVASFAASTVLSSIGLSWALALVGIGFPALGLLGLPVLRRLDVETAERVEGLRARTHVLQRLDLFAAANQAVLEQLAGSAEPRTVPAGTELIAQGDPADAFWVLTEGELAVTARLDDGTDVELPPVHAPGYVGELGLLHRRPRSATVRTASECRLLEISGAAFLNALDEAAPSPTMLSRAGVRLARTTVPQPALSD